MSLDTIFTTGSLAKGYRDIAEWYGQHTFDMHVGDRQEVLIPFFGFGRLASAICDSYTSIDCVDFQRLSWAIGRGIFMTSEYRTNIDRPHFRQGAAVNGEFLKGEKYAPDIRSAGFIDYVVKHGTPLDVACLGLAIPSMTLRGWLTEWTGSFSRFWRKFYEIREACRPQVGMPGAWRQFEDDFFELQTTGVLDKYYDVIALDPPRLCPTVDLYSRGWSHLNHTLGGRTKIQPWTPWNYVHNLDRIMQVKSQYLLFTWTEGDGPPYKGAIEYWLMDQGTIEDQIRWDTHRKRIHGWRVRRFDD